MKFVPYLMFTGNAEEAMAFYAEAFNGTDVEIMRFDTMPPSDDMPPLEEDYLKKVMHGSMMVAGEPIYFSDAFPGTEIKAGSNLEINLNLEDEGTLRSMFAALSDGGEVTMPLGETFWGSLFGSVTDKYGFRWMLGMSLDTE